MPVKHAENGVRGENQSRLWRMLRAEKAAAFYTAERGKLQSENVLLTPAVRKIFHYRIRGKPPITKRTGNWRSV